MIVFYKTWPLAMFVLNIGSPDFVKGCADEDIPTLINLPERAPSNVFPDDDVEVSDFYIRDGWYRAQTDKQLILSDHSIYLEYGMCGTYYPIYLRESHPDVSILTSTPIEVEACLQDDIYPCDVVYNVKIRKCGDEIQYYLVSTRMYAGYCFAPLRVASTTTTPADTTTDAILTTPDDITTGAILTTPTDTVTDDILTNPDDITTDAIMTHLRTSIKTQPTAYSTKAQAKSSTTRPTTFRLRPTTNTMDKESTHQPDSPRADELVEASNGNTVVIVVAAVGVVLGITGISVCMVLLRRQNALKRQIRDQKTASVSNSNVSQRPGDLPGVRYICPNNPFLGSQKGSVRSTTSGYTTCTDVSAVSTVYDSMGYLTPSDVKNSSDSVSEYDYATIDSNYLDGNDYDYLNPSY